MQKYVKNEKRYRLINFICLLAVYKKLIGTGRVLGTSFLRYEWEKLKREIIQSLIYRILPKVNQVIYTLDTIYDPNIMTLAKAVLYMFFCSQAYVGL